MDGDEIIERARETARTLYEGVVTPHRSCGIAIAETFGRTTGPYQALRKGGITGCGECGAVVGGRLVLGELLGDPDPTGAVTPALRGAMVDFEARVAERVDQGEGIVCNTLTARFSEFRSPERAAFCTGVAATVAEAVAEAAIAQGASVDVSPIDGDA